MLGASSSEDEDYVSRDDLSEVIVLSVPPRGHNTASTGPGTSYHRSVSPTPSDTSYASSYHGTQFTPKRERIASQRPQTSVHTTPTMSSMNAGGASPSVSQRRPSSPSESLYSEYHGPPMPKASNVDSSLSHEEQQRIQAEKEEQERRLRMQLYVLVAKCIAYHFNAKQPTDMARRQMKVTKSELGKVKERFQSFLHGETQIAADEAFINAVQSYLEVFLCSERVQQVVQAGGFSAHDFREVFRLNIEKRIRSLPEIDGLSKETVLNSWMTKFDTIVRGDDDPNRTSRGRIRPGQHASADLILGKDQLYDMFQQILGVKKFEHQLIYNALQLDNPDEQAAAIRREVETRKELLTDMQKDRKLMPKFVVKDMETLYVDEVRSNISLLVANLESVPVASGRGAGGIGRKPNRGPRCVGNLQPTGCHSPSETTTSLPNKSFASLLGPNENYKSKNKCVCGNYCWS